MAGETCSSLTATHEHPGKGPGQPGGEGAWCRAPSPAACNELIHQLSHQGVHVPRRSTGLSGPSGLAPGRLPVGRAGRGQGGLRGRLLNPQVLSPQPSPWTKEERTVRAKKAEGGPHKPAATGLENFPGFPHQTSKFPRPSLPPLPAKPGLPGKRPRSQLQFPPGALSLLSNLPPKQAWIPFSFLWERSDSLAQQASLSKPYRAPHCNWSPPGSALQLQASGLTGQPPVAKDLPLHPHPLPTSLHLLSLCSTLGPPRCRQTGPEANSQPFLPGMAWEKTEGHEDAGLAQNRL